MENIIEYIRELIVKNKPDALILEYLRRKKGVAISIRTLQRYKQKYNLVRHDNTVAPLSVQNAVVQERASTGLNAGVRFLQIALRQRHGLLVTRRQVENVCTMLDGVNPDGRANSILAERRLRYSPGPNYRWCADGHDKLGRFGVYIHGCVDEFSRRLIWLRAFSTNRSQPIVTKYYLQAVSTLGVVPDCVVTDFGHECDTIADCQQFFFRHDDQPRRHHRWTYSIVNVTIEAFWKRLRAISGDYWIREFEALLYDGHWDGSEADNWCLLAVYLPLINADLDRTAMEHNSHRIRSQPGTIRPSGAPEDIYEMPDAYGGRICGLEVNDADVRSAMLYAGLNDLELPDFLPIDTRGCIDSWMHRNAVSVTVQNASTVYRQLRELCAHLMNRV